VYVWQDGTLSANHQQERGPAASIPGREGLIADTLEPPDSNWLKQTVRIKRVGETTAEDLLREIKMKHWPGEELAKRDTATGRYSPVSRSALVLESASYRLVEMGKVVVTIWDRRVETWTEKEVEVFLGVDTSESMAKRWSRNQMIDAVHVEQRLRVAAGQANANAGNSLWETNIPLRRESFQVEDRRIVDRL
jgi:hypothetical protein